MFLTFSLTLSFSVFQPSTRSCCWYLSQCLAWGCWIQNESETKKVSIIVSFHLLVILFNVSNFFSYFQFQPWHKRLMSRRMLHSSFVASKQSSIFLAFICWIIASQDSSSVDLHHGNRPFLARRASFISSWDIFSLLSSSS